MNKLPNEILRRVISGNPRARQVSRQWRNIHNYQYAVLAAIEGSGLLDGHPNMFVIHKPSDPLSKVQQKQMVGVYKVSIANNTLHMVHLGGHRLAGFAEIRLPHQYGNSYGHLQLFLEIPEITRGGKMIVSIERISVRGNVLHLRLAMTRAPRDLKAPKGKNINLTEMYVHHAYRNYGFFNRQIPVPGGRISPKKALAHQGIAEQRRRILARGATPNERALLRAINISKLPTANKVRAKVRKTLGK